MLNWMIENKIEVIIISVFLVIIIRYFARIIWLTILNFFSLKIENAVMGFGSGAIWGIVFWYIVNLWLGISIFVILSVLISIFVSRIHKDDDEQCAEEC